MTTENNKDDRTISIKDLINIFDDPNLQGIITKYEEVCKEANKKIEFNIFRMLSDYYYRENFHGDILEVFLNPKGGHGEGDKFLNLFLQMIKKDNIKISDYEINPQLVREYRIDGNRRIDFVIESGKNCIIIENKLYDAVDQDNQLPSYVKAMEEKGKKVDAVIYLPLSAGKTPDKSTWTDDNVTPLLQIICAERLIIDWLVPCIKNSKKEDSRVILNHYKEMLGSLIPNKEKEDIMEELLQYLKDGELKKAIQIKEMLNNMPSHMELSVHEKLKTNLSGNACEKYKIEETTWSKCVVTIPETKDVIYLQCAFKEKDAYEILIAVEGEFKIYDSEEFEKRVNGRPDLNGTKWDIKPESDNNKALRLVKYFNFNEDDEVVEFLKNLIEQITKSKN